jgi:hypothetical protein
MYYAYSNIEGKRQEKERFNDPKKHRTFLCGVSFLCDSHITLLHILLKKKAFPRIFDKTAML